VTLEDLGDSGWRQRAGLWVIVLGILGYG
jgi:hypothetical protein